MIEEKKIFKPSGNEILSEYMEKYEGEYILIQDFETSKEKVVEHNKDLSKILKLAENYPKDKVIIDYIPPSGIIYF